MLDDPDREWMLDVDVCLLGLIRAGGLLPCLQKRAIRPREDADTWIPFAGGWVAQVMEQAGGMRAG